MDYNRPKRGETKRNLHQLLNGKQLYCALYGTYTDVLHDLTALKQSAAKAETARTTITEPPSNEEFRDQRRQMQKPKDNTNKRVKKPTTSTKGVNNQSKPAVPTQNFFAPLSSTEMKTDHGEDKDDIIKCQQQQAQSSQAGRWPHIVLTSQVNQIQ
jgi:hypothetical protein